MTPEQIQQLIAAGVPAATVAAMLQAQPAAASSPASGLPAWAQDIANAEQGNKSKPNLRGLDGVYVADVCEIKHIMSQKDNTEYLITELEIRESTHPAVVPGERRSVSINLSRKAGKGDAQALVLQILSAVTGQDVTKAALADPRAIPSVTGPEQVGQGLRCKIHVHTRPQVSNPAKSWTNHDFTFLPAGAVLGLQVNHASPMPVAETATATAAAPAIATAPGAPPLPANLQALLAAAAAAGGAR